MNQIFDICQRLMDAHEMAMEAEYDAEAIKTTIELLDMELEDKADQIAMMSTTVRGNIETAKNEINRLKALVTKLESFDCDIRGHLRYAMTYTGKTKFKTALHSYSIRKTPQSVSVYDIGALLGKEEWYKPRDWNESELNKTKIKDALKAGEIIPGVELKQGESLTIR